MINGRKIVAVIPARGGSKGIFLKNIAILHGEPLISYSIRAAQNSKYIDTIIVSTDNIEIAKVSKKYGINKIVNRPAFLSTDQSSSEDAISHALTSTNLYVDHDIFILLQPTSPLRNSDHIDKALEEYHRSENATSLISVAEVKQHPELMKEMRDDGHLYSYLKNQSGKKRRQEFSDLYYPNGAIYITNIDRFLEENELYGVSSIGFMMDYIDSIDIDTPADLHLCELILNGNGF